MLDYPRTGVLYCCSVFFESITRNFLMLEALISYLFWLASTVYIFVGSQLNPRVSDWPHHSQSPRFMSPAWWLWAKGEVLSVFTFNILTSSLIWVLSVLRQCYSSNSQFIYYKVISFWRGYSRFVRLRRMIAFAWAWNLHKSALMDPIRVFSDFT